MPDIDFWTDFDDKFNPGPILVDNSGNVIVDENGELKRRISRDIYDPLMRVLQLDGVFVSNYDRLTGKLNVENFRQAINPNINKDLKMLSQEQLKIIKKYFTIGKSDLRDAFEYFGQGSLYDSTHDFLRMYEHPITGEIIPYRIHMADGSGIYGTWHTFIRASILLGIEEKSWIEIDRLLAVAYMIHYTVKPLQSY
jgi:hypothetical protein